MPDSPLTSGDTLHAITRRLFAAAFIGEIVSAGDGVCEVHGYTHVIDPTNNVYQRRPQARRLIFALGDAGHIVKKLPPEVAVDSLECRNVDRR